MTRRFFSFFWPPPPLLGLPGPGQLGSIYFPWVPGAHGSSDSSSLPHIIEGLFGRFLGFFWFFRSSDGKSHRATSATNRRLRRDRRRSGWLRHSSTCTSHFLVDPRITRKHGQPRLLLRHDHRRPARRPHRDDRAYTTPAIASVSHQSVTRAEVFLFSSTCTEISEKSCVAYDASVPPKSAWHAPALF